MAIIAAILLISAAAAGIVGYVIVPENPSHSTTVATTTNSAITTATSTTCPPITPADDQKLSSQAFDAVTVYSLPQPIRSPNAITVAPDGSVWFGENALPGVAHLYPNGTLKEYPWDVRLDSAISVCGGESDIWGITLWNGSVWAADEFYSRLVGVNPTTGAQTVLQLQNGSEPYTLTVGPDNYMWFTQVFDGPKIGRVTPGTDAIRYYPLPGNSSWASVFLLFQNSTRGYVLAINPESYHLNDYTGASQIYSFDPEAQTPTFQALGSNATLYEPIAMSLGDGGLWVTEHDASGMAFFNTTTSTLTDYPLSSVPYSPIDLSYFAAANGSSVWFNEHYANKIGLISGNGSFLTEYSESDPPIDNFSNIDNALTIAMGTHVLWFTGWTANVIGFVNASYVPPFSVSLPAGVDNSTVTIPAGGSKTVQVDLSGHSSGNLSFQFSDNERYDGTPTMLSFAPGSGSSTTIPSLSGSETASINISAAKNATAGAYIGAITVTDGLISQSVYVHVVVAG